MGAFQAASWNPLADAGIRQLIAEVVREKNSAPQQA
jgi:hypothetical protein